MGKLRQCLSVFAVLLLVTFTACSQSDQAPGNLRSVSPVNFGSLLPAPSTLPSSFKAPAKGASYEAADLYRYGSDNKASLGSQRVTGNSTSLIYKPVYAAPDGTLADLAYAYYEFQISDYAGDASLNYRPTFIDGAPDDVYFALADWNSDRWKWLKTSAGGSIQLSSLTPYLDANDRLLVCVVVMGNQNHVLDDLRIGSAPPVPVFTKPVYLGVAPLVFTLDASLTTDPDNAIAEYRWDANDDLTDGYEVSTGTDPQLDYLQDSAGEAGVRLEVIDEAGVHAHASTVVIARKPTKLGYGTVGTEEILAGAVVDPGTGIVAAFGNRNDGGNLETIVIVEAHGDRTMYEWHGAGNDEISAAAGSYSNAFSVGYTDSFGAGGQDALIQRWTPDQTMNRFALGSALFDESFSGVAVDQSSGDIYCVGSRVDGASESDGLIACITAGLNLKWVRTIDADGHNCSLYDAAVDPSTGAVSVVGRYEDLSGDGNALYAVFDSQGNLTSASTYGQSGTNELGYSVVLDSTGTITGWIAGSEFAVGSNAFIAEIGGPGVDVMGEGYSDTSSYKLLQTDATTLTLLARGRPTLQPYGALLGDFTLPLSPPIGSRFLTLRSTAANESFLARGAVQYGENALFVFGESATELPALNQVNMLASGSPLQWADINPGVESPVLAFTLIPGSGDEITANQNPADAAGDAFLDYLQYPTAP